MIFWQLSVEHAEKETNVQKATIAKFIGLRGKIWIIEISKCFLYQEPEKEIYWKVKKKKIFQVKRKSMASSLFIQIVYDIKFILSLKNYCKYWNCTTGEIYGIFMHKSHRHICKSLGSGTKFRNHSTN